ncbi:alpha/beta fold hydrolase [Mucilaginibacter angelicae]|uniref:Alpha/beta fold hydrolase n=1 Tax=Mucilaginibacter angelicae TaxID=869718 RepID=A0ABV6KYN5_9SPHI
MKNRRIIKLMKSAVAVVLLALGIVFVSCKNDNTITNTPAGGSKDYHQTAETKFITADGNKIAYRILGNKAGTPLVLLSPLGNAMDDWDPAITNGLAQKYKVIIFDLPGVGTSSGATPDNIPDMAKESVSFIKGLGYNKVNLLGFSMGSFISQQIALTEPALVNKIILTGTGPKGSEGLSDLPKFLAASANLTPEQVFLASFFASSATSQSAGKSAYERVQERQVNRDAPISPEGFTNEVKAVLGWAQPNTGALTELKSVTQPVLIVQGQEDALVPVVNAINMSKSLPNARLIVYPDAAHAAFFQYHDDFVKNALEFLGK